MGKDAPVRRLALLLEYEGTEFGGSQYQNNTRTIQGALESALSSLTGEPIRVTMAGRTDAGVHARGQVAAFNTVSAHPIDVVLRAANYHLPRQIAVRAVREVDRGFSPRRRAVSRWYRYTVDNSPWRPALLRRVAWHVPEPLDARAMNEAAGLMVGEHDFAAFTQPSAVKRLNTCRRWARSRVSRRGNLVVLDVEGNGFLPHQVRRTIGALAEVGRGKMTVAEFESLLREARPGAASYTAPARGLCLMKVRYENGLFDEETDADIQP